MLLLGRTSCSVTLYLQHHVPVFISAAGCTQLDWDSLPAAGVAQDMAHFREHSSVCLASAVLAAGCLSPVLR